MTQIAQRNCGTPGFEPRSPSRAAALSSPTRRPIATGGGEGWPALGRRGGPLAGARLRPAPRAPSPGRCPGEPGGRSPGSGQPARGRGRPGRQEVGARSKSGCEVPRDTGGTPGGGLATQQPRESLVQGPGAPPARARFVSTFHRLASRRSGRGSPCSGSRGGRGPVSPGGPALGAAPLPRRPPAPPAAAPRTRPRPRGPRGEPR